MARLSILAALLLDAASAHTIFNQIGYGGKNLGQGVGLYMPSSNVYQSDVNANTMACNGAPATGFTSSSTVVQVNAGDTITGAWLHELGATGPGNDADNKVIASSHKGPVLAYMKKVADATANPSSGPGDGWFKIAQAGLISSNQWAVDKLISDGGIQTVTIPSCLETGDYLLRFEIIALHSASQQKGAQFYMECAQLHVTGSSSPQAPTTYKIPGIYSATDPGILVSIYNSQGKPYPSSYTIPGPPVFTCGAGGGSPPSSTKSATTLSTSTKAATTTSKAAATTTTSKAAATTSASSGATVAKYGQCGGSGYNGPTQCASGSTCTASNQYYSQCL